MGRMWWVALLLCWVLSPCAAGQFSTFESRYYVITSDVSDPVAQRIAAHLDAVCQTYLANLPPLAAQPKLPVYLFSHRQDYLDYAGKLGADPASLSTTGCFWATDKWQGIIVCLDGTRNLSPTLLTLQHECTHQYLYARYGKHVPIWLNEGLATYLKYGVIGKEGMLIGIVPVYTLGDVYGAIKQGTYVPLAKLLTLSHADWLALTATDPKTAHLCYEEAWSVVHFLMHGKEGANRQRMFDYLLQTSQGWSQTRIFSEVFQMDYTAFEQEWKDYVLQLAPDVSPTELLGIAQKYIKSPPTEPVTINITPKAWADEGRTTTVSVLITPGKSPLSSDFTATCPRYILHLSWTLDDAGKPLEQFNYEGRKQ